MPRLRMPDQVADLGQYLREQREQARLSVRQLALVAGVSNPYLSQIERGLRKPSAEVLQQIAKGLRISAEALYVRAGILEESASLDVEIAIRTDPQLTERQRRVLLEIYASFQAENGRRDAAAKEPAEHADGPAPARTARKASAGTARKASAATARKASAGTATAEGSTDTKVTARRAAGMKTAG